MPPIGSFCTVINCMDGRVQQPAWEFLRRRFDVDYVDTVTEPGPVALLEHADETSEDPLVRNVIRRVRIAVNKHASVGIAVAAHAGCAGNPVDEATQRRQLQLSVDWVRRTFPSVPAIGLWIDEQWQVHEVC